MLKMNVVKTQWAHVNRGVVNVHQDLRNDMRAICICVQMDAVMRKNVVAIGVIYLTHLLVHAHQTIRDDLSMTGIRFTE